MNAIASPPSPMEIKVRANHIRLREEEIMAARQAGYFGASGWGTLEAGLGPEALVAKLHGAEFKEDFRGILWPWEEHIAICCLHRLRVAHWLGFLVSTNDFSMGECLLRYDDALAKEKGGIFGRRRY